MKYFLCMIGLIISAGLGAMEDAPLPLDHPDAAVPAFSKPLPLKKSSTLKKEKRRQKAGRSIAQQSNLSKMAKKPLKANPILHRTDHKPSSKMVLKQGRPRRK